MVVASSPCVGTLIAQFILADACGLPYVSLGYLFIRDLLNSNSKPYFITYEIKIEGQSIIRGRLYHVS